MTNATFSLDSLHTLLASVRLRKYSGGRTCLLAAMSLAPRLECDCHNGRRVPDSWRDMVARAGTSRVSVQPISRGHIQHVIDRVARNGGRAEVLRTWGCGVRALRAEPRYTLHGGREA